MRRSRKPLNLYGFREFESHPHRHTFSSLRASEAIGKKAQKGSILTGAETKPTFAFLRPTVIATPSLQRRAM